MWDEPVTLERWDYWRGRMPASLHDRDIAVKCLFLNRTTFSGILHGRAGPDWLTGFGHHQLAEYLRRWAQNRWILSYDHHPDLTTDPRLYSVGRMSPSRDDAEKLLGVHRWPISKRLVDLRYSASAVNAHRGQRQELLLTTLPPSCVPLNDRMRALPNGHPTRLT